VALTDPAELGAWLRLIETPQVGRESARKLLAAFGSPEAVFAAPLAARREVVPAPIAQALGDVPAVLPERLASLQAWLAGSSEACPRQAIALGDPDYPDTLLQSGDPPLLLFTQGALHWLRQPCVALVGSRHATPQGLDNARAFAQALSHAGLTVVSGLALGIDGAAHEGALLGRGKTIAVVGTGLDRVYPRRHLPLAHQIAREGLMISEYSPGTPPLAPHFPQRNRLIAGLCLGTLVVEAALQSGSLITARLAAEAGREVLAIPGSIHAPQSRGCHALIKQGAKLVECAQDVIDELRLQLAPTLPLEAAPPSEPHADPLLTAMAFDPVGLDALAARTGLPSHELSSQLLTLELEGRVARLPGQLFQRLVGA
jgi:DNA processing protein